MTAGPEGELVMSKIENSEASGSGRGLAVGGDGVDVVEADVGAIEAVRLVYFGNVFGFRECDVDALEMRC